MKASVVATAVAGLLVAGCAGGVDSARLNPLNWFEDNKEPEPAQEVVTQVPVTTSSTELMPIVRAVNAEQFASGIILIASGVPPTFGYHDPVLEPINEGRPINGELVFELRAKPPQGALPEGTEESREISVAKTLSQRQLQGVTSIRVMGAVNEQIVSL